ncbi:MAG TPA: acetyl-CoA C-acetyltransferase [Idiomarina abyssalis]|jgi:acetyl-CoA C-acetyltransferase|uniref:Acetyl-CoA C-acyltransferase n=2 Tax=Idiomarina TaxID=135575 RepID=A0A8I1G3S5_9GAMM|nr:MULTISPECIES: acetyl-CoA C-acyltransferase [Idiomarina]MBH95549.1 acetyl-CoA C-acyltransferase [Idiomarina sp.]MBJ7267610.1 acetyl-CoA C-acyltransferase [Idiomarina abyssalis]MBJ7272913.1 acetyl-CoA C-acyltransferase [Idiomarina abyssalis]MBJ7315428.1 acetyl-CoA C-acyltransferase [Idiomarina abyssalis]HAS14994.1 acetyl-CoA C-acetyltransferase [Idiomarina abyssalis]|tara:strand:- start:444878 stop:446059 length:1182 start_codon:yes stop_codon:yes gene_type:complete
MSSDSIVIVAANRTPMGGFQGCLSEVSAPNLGAAAIKAALSNSGLKAGDISEVIMGNVLPAGLGQAPARQAMLYADLPRSTGATTINKVCGSGLKAAMMAHDLIKAGSADVVLAGGMESMSNAPYMLPKGRSGYRMGHGQVLDHMMFDGLEDAYENKAMGSYAQSTADEYGIDREAMDEFAIHSLTKAQTAIKDGLFKDEITAVTYSTRKGEVTVDTDEQPGKARLDKIPQLRAAFKKDGTITAANSSSISDGAAALILMRESEAKAKGLQPLARVMGHTTHSQAPSEFTIAPIGAMNSLLSKLDWTKDDVDLWEINEAFAMVTMLAIQEMKLDASKVNVHGGACALGHPIGASGARLLVTLLHALKQKGQKRGITSLCIGGGEAVALAVEMI